MTLNVTRSAVHASDEPERMKIDAGAAHTLRELLALVKQADYLASISGGKATWSARIDGRPVAIVAQEWSEPKFIASPDTRYNGKEVAIAFRYHAQTPPDQVFAELSGKRVP